MKGSKARTTLELFLKSGDRNEGWGECTYSSL